MLFVDRAAVLGAGIMGARIATVLALNNVKVTLRDVKQEYLDKGLATIQKDLDELVAFHAAKADKTIDDFEKKAGVALTDEQKAKVRANLKPTYTADRAKKILANITPTTSYDGFDKVDLVIEAVPEVMDIKKAVFKELTAATQDHTIIASNTSTFSVTDMAAGLPPNRRGRFLGLHFFNPPTMLPLIEVIPGVETRADIVEDVVNWLAPMRNFRFPIVPIQVKECPGFLVNRILFPMFAEAITCYEEGVASPKDIDLAMQAGAGMPMGPLALMDMIGLDTILHGGVSIMQQYGGIVPHRTTPSLRRLVAAGRFGQKTGRGFHDYRKE